MKFKTSQEALTFMHIYSNADINYMGQRSSGWENDSLVDVIDGVEEILITIKDLDKLFHKLSGINRMVILALLENENCLAASIECDMTVMAYKSRLKIALESWDVVLKRADYI